MLDTFGIEEEFMLVDRRTLAPAQIAASAIAPLAAQFSECTVTSEFLQSQVEHASRVCRTPEDAQACLLEFRAALASWADQHDVIPVASGTPFHISHEHAEFPDPRYRQIASDIGLLASEHYLNGMHVHAGIGSVDEGVRVMNGLRPWLPVLLAVSANSPFWAGSDSGHHSWRAIQTRRWTTNGIPPHVENAEEYQEIHDRMVGVGATQKYSKTNWAIRLSEHYPTVEVRVFDVQLTTRAAVSIALVLRALASAAADGTLTSAPVRSHVLDAELWHAARWGLSNGLYDPLSGEHASADFVLSQALHVTKPYLERADALGYVRPFMRELELGITGASRQRESLFRGVMALGALYRSSVDAA